MAARKQPKKLDQEGLWEYALGLLGQRPYSVADLRKKLAGRAEAAADVPPVITKLKEYGLVNDQKFSESFASSRLQNQGFGKFRVIRELRVKRVAPKIAEEAVSKVFAGTEEKDLIEQFLARKYRGKDLKEFLSEEKNLASAYRRLRTAGFTSAGSFSVLKRYARELEEWKEQEE
ncbi:MAG TPA: regulatory protein RecX [Bryobacteraceae bacterium]|jgi:regulatory protein|nr:regulatory protein RecX [Bryobacteraceae bacterium]